jgi:hypothetical protein
MLASRQIEFVERSRNHLACLLLWVSVVVGQIAFQSRLDDWRESVCYLPAMRSIELELVLTRYRRRLWLVLAGVSPGLVMGERLLMSATSWWSKDPTTHLRSQPCFGSSPHSQPLHQVGQDEQAPGLRLLTLCIMM